MSARGHLKSVSAVTQDIYAGTIVNQVPEDVPWYELDFQVGGSANAVSQSKVSLHVGGSTLLQECGVPKFYSLPNDGSSAVLSPVPAGAKVVCNVGTYVTGFASHLKLTPMPGVTQAAVSVAHTVTIAASTTKLDIFSGTPVGDTPADWPYYLVELCAASAASNSAASGSTISLIAGNQTLCEASSVRKLDDNELQPFPQREDNTIVQAVVAGGTKLGCNVTTVANGITLIHLHCAPIIG